MKFILFLAVFIINVSCAFAQEKESYACIEDASFGMRRFEGKIESGRAAHKSMIFVKQEKTITVKYRLDSVDVEEKFYCENVFDESFGVVQCMEKWNFLVFNTKNFSFNRATMYLTSKGSTPDPLLISSGTCQKL